MILPICRVSFYTKTFLSNDKMSIRVENDTKEGLLRWNKLSSDNQSVAWLPIRSRAHATVFRLSHLIGQWLATLLPPKLSSSLSRLSQPFYARLAVMGQKIVAVTSNLTFLRKVKIDTINMRYKGPRIKALL